jgi:hypothetical protein
VNAVSIDNNERTNWTAWDQLSPEQQDDRVADPKFWQALDETQRRSFLERGDWKHVREIEDARAAKIGSLVPIDIIAADIGLLREEIFRLVTTRGLPSWLIDGRWMFDAAAVRRWLDGEGGRHAVDDIRSRTKGDAA